MSAYRLDSLALYALLQQNLSREQMSWRDLGEALDISASTFTRMSRGRAPSAHHLLTLLAWLGMAQGLSAIIEWPDAP